MNGRMKVMIAYDGSVYADDAIDGLRRAGITQDAETLIVTVVEPSVVNPPISEFDLQSLVSRRAAAVLRRAKAHKERVIEDAKDSAAKVADHLRAQFSEWKTGYEVLQGKPADELLQKADEWQPDLIVVGSQGRGAIGRFFLGSVSKKVAEEANCSVRVVHRGIEKTIDEATKILGGASNLTDAERIIRAIGGRVWSGETEMRLIAVDDGVTPGRVSAVYPYAEEIFELAAAPLVAVGLKVSIDLKSGNLKDVLLAEAENCEADSIFVTANGASDETALNETLSGLITSARCTVEIVR